MDKTIQYLKENEDKIIQELVELDPMHTRNEITKDKSQDKLYESIFADPELTEEDKVCIFSLHLIFFISKTFDRKL